MAFAKGYISETYDPFFNLATEDWIFKDMDTKEHILFLWRNERTVVIGRNQNPWAECNLAKMQEKGVHLVRRQTGGGAVFQDLGNTNFTFLSSKKDYDKQRNFQIVINALNKLGIKAEFSGRNDLVVEGKKISGSAFREQPDRAFHHGTILINANLGELAEYLTPSQKKLIAKGTTSVRSRVANISEFNNALVHEKVSEAIIEEFFAMHNSPKNIENLNHNNLKEITEINNYYNHLKSDAWRFGETPEFQHQLSERFDWGTIDLHLDTEAGKIKRAKIFSDCLDTDFIEKLEKNLHEVDYNKTEIINQLNHLKENLPNSSSHIQDIQNWLSKEIT